MTNDLFRDLLEERLPETRKQIRDRVMARAQASFIPMTDALIKFGQAMSLTAGQIQLMALAFNVQPEPPADPRARALQHKQHQNHGPKDAPLRTRGRNNRYKEKS